MNLQSADPVSLTLLRAQIAFQILHVCGKGRSSLFCDDNFGERVIVSERFFNRQVLGRFQLLELNAEVTCRSFSFLLNEFELAAIIRHQQTDNGQPQALV